MMVTVEEIRTVRIWLPDNEGDQLKQTVEEALEEITLGELVNLIDQNYGPYNSLRVAQDETEMDVY